MNTKLAALLIALLALLPASYASASETLKIGYVNTQRIFRDAPTAVKAAKKIEAEFSKRDQDLQRLNEPLHSRRKASRSKQFTASRFLPPAYWLVAAQPTPTLNLNIDR